MSLLLPILSLIFFAVLTWPAWQWMWGEWMANDYYSHGVLIGPVALFLSWRRLALRTPEEWRIGGDSRGLVLVAAGIGLYLYFLDQRAFYLASFAAVGLVIGFLWTFAGLQTLRRLAFPLGYLLLMVPVPFLDRLTLPLALFAGICSTALVRFFGLDVTIVGNAVTLPNANMVIGAQCSGINSILALTALNALAAYVLAGPWWGRITLFLSAIPLAILSNILRIANLLVVARYFGAETAFRFYHDYSGIIYFLLIVLLLLPLAKVLGCKTLRTDVL